MKKYVFNIALAVGLLLAAIYLSMHLGSVSINIFGELSANQKIILNMRLVRIIFAAVAGVSLSIAGYLYQALLLNQLAEPYLLGVSAGGALGGVLALIFGVPLFVFAVIGSMLALLVVFIFTYKKGHLDNTGLILSGVMVNAFCSALIMLIVTLAANKVNSLLFWLMGDIGSARLTQLWYILPALLVLIALSFTYGRAIDALSLGEEQASYLGINAGQLKVIIFIFASLLTGLVVASVGIIGFVGLVIPHVSRLLSGEQTTRILPLIIILGMAFTILADLLSRVLIPDVILPIGVVTALIGVPFFIYIYKKV